MNDRATCSTETNPSGLCPPFPWALQSNSSTLWVRMLLRIPLKPFAPYPLVHGLNPMDQWVRKVSGCCVLLAIVPVPCYRRCLLFYLQWFEEKFQEIENEDLQLRKLHAVVETLVNHRKGEIWRGGGNYE